MHCHYKLYWQNNMTAIGLGTFFACDDGWIYSLR